MKYLKKIFESNLMFDNKKEMKHIKAYNLYERVSKENKIY